MYKTLCVAAFLLATFALTSGSKPADASAAGLPSPLIVARTKLANQTAPIPTTTIFAPTQDGLYRLSVYMTQTVAVPTSGAYWIFNAAWSDDAGDEAIGEILLNVNQTPSGAYGFFTLLLQVKAGKPITYSTTLSNGTDGGTYSMYFTLERME